MVVVGGGASGLGVAVDASSRGYRTALLEAHDFAKATSSRSTKLVHGGVRYLEQMNFSLVMEALRERGLLYRNAPHVVDDLAFIVPSYKWWEGPFYGIGLKLYDALAGRLNFAKSRRLDRDATIDAIPNVQREGLDGGTMYHDGQFDDARLAITLARTAADHGAVVLNGMEVVGLSRTGGHVDRVRVRDADDGALREVRARVVVNATGIFSDEVRRLDDPEASTMIEPAQGVHLVLDRSFAPGDNAIMVPHTDDGRVLFVIPWHERVLVGTTDTPMTEPELEPRALAEEVGFILRNAARYMAKDPSESDVLGVFAGQRPLVHRGGTRAAASRSPGPTRWWSARPGWSRSWAGNGRPTGRWRRTPWSTRSRSAVWNRDPASRKLFTFVAGWIDPIPRSPSITSDDTTAPTRRRSTSLRLPIPRSPSGSIPDSPTVGPRSRGPSATRWPAPSRTCSLDAPGACFWTREPPWRRPPRSPPSWRGNSGVMRHGRATRSISIDPSPPDTFSMRDGTDPMSDEPTCGRGGLKDWAAWLVAASCLFFQFVVQIQPSAMIEELEVAFAVDAVELGLLASAYFVTSISLQVPVGWLLDRFGPRSVLVTSMVLGAVGLIWFGYASTLDSAIWARCCSASPVPQRSPPRRWSPPDDSLPDASGSCSV